MTLMSTRPRITIGVPVYNGASLLRECLDCLASQTSREFCVLIMDNASTDATPIIAREFAERDPRFRVLRQPQIVDVRQNFDDVLREANTEYFAWRAYDDLCEANWIEELAALLDANPWASLSVGRVLGLGHAGQEEENRDGPLTTGQEGLADIRKLVLSMCPSWIYGLFRRQEISRVYARIRELYPYVWSIDLLVILSFILGRGIVGTNATLFQYRATGLMQRRLRPNHYVDSWNMWRSFHRASRTILEESGLTAMERMALQPVLMRFTHQRTEKLRRIVRGALGAALLGTDGRVRRNPANRIASSQ